jgi:hypothetical protein
MPKTCPAHGVSRFKPPEPPTGKIPNVIELLFSPHQQPFLLKLVHESISSISEVFFDGKYTTELTTLFHCVNKAAHTELLVVFFLLLNVDQCLKRRIMNIEIESNYPKLERFLLDLRRTLVVQFSVNEDISLVAFVEQCEEFWVLA